MMDANEDWEKDAGRELAEFLLESQLEDIHKVRQQPIPTTTYTRGSKRLDYIFMSTNLVGTVRKAGYMPIHDGVISDHRMCYIECNLKEFMGGNVNKIARPHLRDFKCNDKGRCQIFLTELKKHMEVNKTGQRIKELARKFGQSGESEELNKQYNNLDYELQCSIKGAVKKVGRANYGYY